MNSVNEIKITKGKNTVIQDGVTFIYSERNSTENNIEIGDNVVIRTGSIIYSGTKIGKDVTIDHFCIVREGTSIGKNSRIKNRTEIGRDVVIGENCILSGFIANRVEIGSNSSSFGNLVHRYALHGEGHKEPSPRIGNNVIVGVNAIIAGNVKVPDGKRIKAGELISFSNDFKDGK